jgi:hypothetical protein
MIPSRRDLLVTAPTALALHSVAAKAASAGSIFRAGKGAIRIASGHAYAQVLGAIDGHDK